MGHVSVYGAKRLPLDQSSQHIQYEKSNSETELTHVTRTLNETDEMSIRKS